MRLLLLAQRVSPLYTIADGCFVYVSLRYRNRQLFSNTCSHYQPCFIYLTRAAQSRFLHRNDGAAIGAVMAFRLGLQRPGLDIYAWLLDSEQRVYGGSSLAMAHDWIGASLYWWSLIPCAKSRCIALNNLNSYNIEVLAALNVSFILQIINHRCKYASCCLGRCHLHCAKGSSLHSDLRVLEATLWNSNFTFFTRLN